MKLIAIKNNIRTPKYGIVKNENEIFEISERLNYPLFVKQNSAHSSVGLTKDCKCNNFDELLRESKRMLDLYKDIIIEEFIEGREFTVLASENPLDKSSPIIYNPLECIFKNGETFEHFDIKCNEKDLIEWKFCENSTLRDELINMSKQIIIAMKGVGYGRIDFRVDSNLHP